MFYLVIFFFVNLQSKSILGPFYAHSKSFQTIPIQDMCLTKIDDTVETVLNIPILVRMTFCPPRHKLQTLCIGTSDREESFFGIPVSHLFLREFNNRKTRSSRGQSCLALRIHSHHDRLYKAYILLMMHSRQSIGTAKHIISFVLGSLTFK